MSDQGCEDANFAKPSLDCHHARGGGRGDERPGYASETGSTRQYADCGDREAHDTLDPVGDALQVVVSRDKTFRFSSGRDPLVAEEDSVEKIIEERADRLHEGGGQDFVVRGGAVRLDLHDTVIPTAGIPSALDYGFFTSLSSPNHLRILAMRLPMGRVYSHPPRGE